MLFDQNTPPSQASVGLTAAFKLRHRLDVEEKAIDHDQVISPAAQIGLTGYDASYLWLARRRGAELLPRVVHIAGYNLFSFTRASAGVNCSRL
jgi:hypothetical protein